MTVAVVETGLKFFGGDTGGGVAVVAAYPHVLVGNGALVLLVLGMVELGVVVVQTRLWEEAFILSLYPLLWLVVAVKVV